MATKDNITQKAGKASTQINAENVIITQGVTKDEVSALVHSEAEKIIAEANKSATEAANRRLDTFSEILIEKLIKSDKLDSFRDPALQFILRHAEEAAICTDSTDDYNLLSELIVYRTEHPENKTVSASVKKAISEIDNMSVEALNALTLSFSITAYAPMSGSIKGGLRIIDDLFAKLFQSIPLPDNNEWVDDLEITGAIRINPIGNLKKYEDILFDSFTGYFVLGIKENSDDFEKAVGILQDAKIDRHVLIGNELIPGYLRLYLPKINEFDNLLLRDISNHVLNPLSKVQQKAFSDIVKLYSTNPEDTKVLKDNFLSLLKEYDNLSKIATWWNEIAKAGIAFDITPVGRVLANANAKRIDPSLPDFMARDN